MKKINPWPIGITLFLICFAGVVIGGGIWISSHKYHLVSDNYYEKQIAYEEQIQSNSRAQALVEKPSIKVVRSQLEITIPENIRTHFSEGVLTLYRPSQGGLDQTIALTPDIQGQHKVTLIGMLTGNWKAKLEWMLEGEPYSMEQRIEVPKGL